MCTKNEQLVRNGYPKDGHEPKSLKSCWPDMPSTNKNGAKLRSQFAANTCIGKWTMQGCEKESKATTLSRYKYDYTHSQMKLALAIFRPSEQAKER